MLAWEELVEAYALRRRGWPIAAIARHLGRSRNTIKAYLREERHPGVRRRAAADPFEGHAGYVA
jgi:predicted transcriptional regulator